MRGPDEVPLLRYAEVARRHRRVLVLAVLVGALVGAAVALGRPPVFTSTVEVLAPPVPLHAGPLVAVARADAPTRRPREVTLDTEAALVVADPVLDQLSRTPGFPGDRTGLRSSISVTVPPNTHVLVIAVRAASPDAARDGADAVAEGYLALRGSIIGDVQQRVEDSLQRRLTLLQGQLDAVPPEELIAGALSARVESLVDQIGETEDALGAAANRAEQPAEVLRAAELPDSPDDRGTTVSATSGAGTALLLGLAFAVAVDGRPVTPAGPERMER